MWCCRAVSRLTRTINSSEASEEVAHFVADNFDRYNAQPIERADLESMMIVARWLRERAPDEGRVINLTGPNLDPTALSN